MSAISLLKNFAYAITGNIFTPKNNRCHTVSQQQKNKPGSIFTVKKQHRHSNQQLSDFTIL